MLRQLKQVRSRKIHKDNQRQTGSNWNLFRGQEGVRKPMPNGPTISSDWNWNWANCIQLLSIARVWIYMNLYRIMLHELAWASQPSCADAWATDNVNPRGHCLTIWHGQTGRLPKTWERFDDPYYTWLIHSCFDRLWERCCVILFNRLSGRLSI